MALNGQTFECRFTPLRDERGEVTGVIGVATDFTERRRAEDARRVAEDLLHTVTTNAPVVLWACDTQGTCSFIEGGALGGANMFVEALRRRSIIEMFGEEGGIAANLRRALDGERFVDTISYRGRHLETSYTPMRDSSGKVTGVVGVSLDVTERKAVERAWRRAEEQLRTVANAAPIVLFAWDAEGVFTLAEGAGLALAGAEAAKIVGSNVFDVFEGEAEVIAIARRALRGENFAGVIETQGRAWEVHLTAVPGEQGGVEGVIGVLTDITERRRTEQALLQAQKLESLGVLAGGIAHDFNNLLVGIIGNAGLALMELPPASPARETVHAIETAGHRAADLARQMLAYSGKGRFVVEPVGVNALVEEMGSLLRSSITRSALLSYDLADALPAVDADATQLRQVIMNLVLNASDAIGKEQGVIRVTTRTVEADSNSLSSAYLAPDLASGNYVCISVSDTGCGMDEETRARIFDPFFTTKFTGRGLGLAAVLGIVRGHGGAISVTSEPGHGSTFTLLLPASSRTAIAAPPRSHATSPAWPSGGSILVVDDEPTVRAVTARALERLGFAALQAGDGREGVEAFQAHRDTIRCVLLDMTMPRMNGEEAFGELRRLDPTVPIVIMSGYNEQEARGRFEGQHISGFIQKPYDLAVLRDVIGAAVAPAEARAS